MFVSLTNTQATLWHFLIFNNGVTQNLHCESIKEEVCVEIAGQIGGMGGFKIETSHKRA